MDRDARGAAVAEQVDRHGEGRAQQRGVVLFHHVEPQFGAPLLRQRGAEHAASLLEHEVHDFGRDFLRRDDEVAFVLAVFVVDDDHYPAVAEIFNNLFYTIQNRAFAISFEFYRVFQFVDRRSHALVQCLESSGIPVRVEQCRVVGGLVGQVYGDRREDERREPDAVNGFPAALLGQFLAREADDVVDHEEDDRHHDWKSQAALADDGAQRSPDQEEDHDRHGERYFLVPLDLAAV